MSVSAREKLVQTSAKPYSVSRSLGKKELIIIWTAKDETIK